MTIPMTIEQKMEIYETIREIMADGQPRNVKWIRNKLADYGIHVTTNWLAHNVPKVHGLVAQETWSKRKDYILAGE